MKPLAHALILAALLSATSALRLAEQAYYSKDLAKVIGRASAVRAREIQAGWKSQRFDKFDSDATQATVMDKVRQQESGLSDPQRAKLELKVRGILHYFAQPTFEEYYRLRTDGLHYHFSPEGSMSNRLALALQRGKIAPTVDERQIVKFLWEADRERAGVPGMSKITAASVDSFKAAISHTNSGKLLIVGPIRQGFTIAGEVANPGFHYTVSNASDSIPVLFEFSFLAKEDSGVSGPLLVSLLWLEHDQDWALNRLITDQWLPFQTLF